MSRIQQCLQSLKQQGRKALIPYVTAGDPEPGVTVGLMHAMVEAGADIIELGIPFSDPMADGPVIQLACERALVHGTRLVDVLEMVKTFRQQDNQTPVVLMGYLNPIEAIGYDNFLAQASEAGVDGVLTVDLPPEEADSFCEGLKAKGMDAIFLIAPTTTDERIKRICAAGSGYVYYVSVKGVTGSSALDVDAVASNVDRIRQYTSLPVGVGFGIRDAESAAAVAKVADGAIVGSVLVNKIAELQQQSDQIPAAVAEILASMRSAMDQ
ncbi:tryptophan synthase subunit alpha [Motiliproteus coralliicola]|uniref:Tryptophan synthase alpha chain n=1 Tax=Motiliproteus coralliicola TaxID=2283196 RepID=A0A369WSD7_9GAMM|nr:tryptophan synthase subunit alpha [Motiliproteus coralliicola]RDE24471.1 tryptophan synthase subunit alpha [Motiliproteus coralliicola]